MDIKPLFESCCCAIAILLKQSALAYASEELGMDSDYLAQPLAGDEALDLKLQNNLEYFKLEGSDDDESD
jgi:hypothetical protein|tara:strand:- start:73 stop:282 length:210 start_codon:yes stop_codon:yes gene_type:complete